LLWSVTATAGIPDAAAAFTNGFTRTSPSLREYSECTCRWTKLASTALLAGSDADVDRDGGGHLRW
jgi:hypothetical protein